MYNRTVDTISIEDILAYPVWKFSKQEPFLITPVKKTPCKNLTGRIVGTEVVLADGTRVWALIGNIDPENTQLTEHFITISILSNNKWFHLSRYHDYDYKDNGPEKLSEFLKKSIEDIFPISYDIRTILKAESSAAYGKIQKEPNKKLSREEIIALAVP